MMYADIINHMLLLYLGLCLIAMEMARHDNDRASALQAFLYALVIFMFNLAFSGQAKMWRFWWYGWEGIADLFLIYTAFIIWRKLGARSSKWVMVFGIVALTVDLVFMGFSASGHRLPGIWYFRISNWLETLQVVSLLAFAGPMLRCYAKAWKMAGAALHELKRILPWTHHKAYKRI